MEPRYGGSALPPGESTPNGPMRAVSAGAVRSSCMVPLNDSTEAGERRMGLATGSHARSYSRSYSRSFSGSLTLVRAPSNMYKPPDAIEISDLEFMVPETEMPFDPAEVPTFQTPIMFSLRPQQKETHKPGGPVPVFSGPPGHPAAQNPAHWAYAQGGAPPGVPPQGAGQAKGGRFAAGGSGARAAPGGGMRSPANGSASRGAAQGSAYANTRGENPRARPFGVGASAASGNSAAGGRNAVGAAAVAAAAGGRSGNAAGGVYNNLYNGLPGTPAGVVVTTRGGANGASGANGLSGANGAGGANGASGVYPASGAAAAGAHYSVTNSGTNGRGGARGAPSARFHQSVTRTVESAGFAAAGPAMPPAHFANRSACTAVAGGIPRAPASVAAVATLPWGMGYLPGVNFPTAVAGPHAGTATAASTSSTAASGMPPAWVGKSSPLAPSPAAATAATTAAVAATTAATTAASAPAAGAAGGPQVLTAVAAATRPAGGFRTDPAAAQELKASKDARRRALKERDAYGTPPRHAARPLGVREVKARDIASRRCCGGCSH